MRYVRLQERGLDGKEGKLEVGSGRGEWMDGMDGMDGNGCCGRIQYTYSI